MKCRGVCLDQSLKDTGVHAKLAHHVLAASLQVREEIARKGGQEEACCITECSSDNEGCVLRCG